MQGGDGVRDARGGGRGDLADPDASEGVRVRREADKDSDESQVAAVVADDDRDDRRGVGGGRAGEGGDAGLARGGRARGAEGGGDRYLAEGRGGDHVHERDDGQVQGRLRDAREHRLHDALVPDEHADLHAGGRVSGVPAVGPHHGDDHRVLAPLDRRVDGLRLAAHAHRHGRQAPAGLPRRRPHPQAHGDALRPRRPRQGLRRRHAQGPGLGGLQVPLWAGPRRGRPPLRPRPRRRRTPLERPGHEEDPGPHRGPRPLLRLGQRPALEGRPDLRPDLLQLPRASGLRLHRDHRRLLRRQPPRQHARRRWRPDPGHLPPPPRLGRGELHLGRPPRRDPPRRPLHLRRLLRLRRRRRDDQEERRGLRHHRRRQVLLHRRYRRGRRPRPPPHHRPQEGLIQGLHGRVRRPLQGRGSAQALQVRRDSHGLRQDRREPRHRPHLPPEARHRGPQEDPRRRRPLRPRPRRQPRHPQGRLRSPQDPVQAVRHPGLRDAQGLPPPHRRRRRHARLDPRQRHAHLHHEAQAAHHRQGLPARNRRCLRLLTSFFLDSPSMLSVSRAGRDPSPRSGALATTSAAEPPGRGIHPLAISVVVGRRNTPRNERARTLRQLIVAPACYSTSERAAPPPAAFLRACKTLRAHVPT
mmetsp:Transcript_19335/g.60832  ORF Transcript_19335/g.60832 Transcript_19335/m.60832 type:complete len:640 (+) Transcript_19335:529-2448(+)